MNDRKQHVINMAHQLFVEKGFHATSIQDILEYSRISKGTFYNYFSSKSELLIALLKSIFKKLEHDRNELLIGQDPSDIEIFIKQTELQMMTNRKNKLLPLYEEVIGSNDEVLKQFMKQGQVRMIQWVYKRFIDIFGEDKKTYLLDAAIMFLGILQYNLRYYALAHPSNLNIQNVIRYSMERIVNMVDEVVEADVHLVHPDILAKWLPDCHKAEHSFVQELSRSILILKNSINDSEFQKKYLELLDFIQDELVHSKKPRIYIIESTLLSLETTPEYLDKKELQKLKQLISNYFIQTK